MVGSVPNVHIGNQRFLSLGRFLILQIHSSLSQFKGQSRRFSPNGCGLQFWNVHGCPFLLCNPVYLKCSLSHPQWEQAGLSFKQTTDCAHSGPNAKVRTSPFCPYEAQLLKFKLNSLGLKYFAVIALVAAKLSNCFWYGTDGRQARRCKNGTLPQDARCKACKTPKYIEQTISLR